MWPRFNTYKINLHIGAALASFKMTEIIYDVRLLCTGFFTHHEFRIQMGGAVARFLYT